MDIKSDWGNFKTEDIIKDLIEIEKIAKKTPNEKFIPIYPEWVRNYAKQFEIIENKDFMVAESYMEVE